MRQLTINIDMDGVIYCMMDQLAKTTKRESVRAYMQAEGYTLPENPSSDIGVWQIWDAWGIPKKAFWKLFYLAIDEGLFLEGEAIPDAVNTIGKLVKDGHRIRIVTSKQLAGRNESLMAQTHVLQWLHNNTPWSNKVEIVFAHNKQGYLADVIIDDKPTLSWAQPYSINVLFDRPWNRTTDAPGVGCYPMENTLYRANGWHDVKYLISKIQKELL